MVQKSEQGRELQSVYLVFRYFIITSDTEQLAIPFERESKEQLFLNELKRIASRRKVNHKYYANTYTFYATLNFDNETFVLKLAKKVSDTINVEKGDDLVESKIESFDYVHIIINTRFQLVLIQNNTQVFERGVAKNIVEDFFSKKLLLEFYTFKIDPKSKPEGFWHIVDDAEDIYDLTVTINAPNHPLFGDEEMRDAIKMLRDETNNEEATLTVKSSYGNYSTVQKDK